MSDRRARVAPRPPPGYDSGSLHFGVRGRRFPRADGSPLARTSCIIGRARPRPSRTRATSTKPSPAHAPDRRTATILDRGPARDGGGGRRLAGRRPHAGRPRPDDRRAARRAARAGRTSRPSAPAGGDSSTAKVVDSVFADNAEHPPLGRWLLGLASTLGEPFEVLLLGGPDPVGLYVVAARLAPASAFAVLVGLVVRASGEALRAARPGVVAGFALVAMPRVFAHAHLGALDTFLCLFWTLALLRAERALEAPSARPGHGGGGGRLGAGPADQDPRLVLAADPARLGPRPGRPAQGRRGPRSPGPRPASALFVLGWPWLWYDLAGRLTRYLGTGVVRVPIRVQYFGQVYRRPRRPLALSLVLLRGHGPGRAPPARRLGPGPRLARPPGRPLPAPAGRLDRPLPGRLQHEGPGLRRRAALPGRLPALGDPDRPGVRIGLGVGSRAAGAASRARGGGARRRATAWWPSTRSG